MDRPLPAARRSAPKASSATQKSGCVSIESPLELPRSGSAVSILATLSCPAPIRQWRWSARRRQIFARVAVTTQSDATGHRTSAHKPGHSVLTARIGFRRAVTCFPHVQNGVCWKSCSPQTAWEAGGRFQGKGGRRLEVFDHCRLAAAVTYDKARANVLTASSAAFGAFTASATRTTSAKSPPAATNARAARIPAVGSPQRAPYRTKSMIVRFGPVCRIRTPHMAFSTTSTSEAPSKLQRRMRGPDVPGLPPCAPTGRASQARAGAHSISPQRWAADMRHTTALGIRWQVAARSTITGSSTASGRKYEPIAARWISPPSKAFAIACDRIPAARRSTARLTEPSARRRRSSSP